MICWLTGLILDRINYVDTRNKLANMLPKESFTRDEWDHFFWLLNMSWISRCFFAAIFFQTKKQSVMSNRALEGTTKKSSAVTKQRQMCLVSRNFLSAKKPFRKIRLLRTGWIKSRITVMFYLTSGNWSETATKTQWHILKDGMTLFSTFSALTRRVQKVLWKFW